MKVGDLVKIKQCNDPFNFKPKEGSVGVIVEISHFNWVGTCYFVWINNIGWRYVEEELEIIENGSR
jgi:hypothetical protein